MAIDSIPGIALQTFERTLQQGITGEAKHVIVGLNWTLVIGPSGAGLAHTPARGTHGCRSLPHPGTYAGRPIAELAALWGAQNVFEHAIAVAAVNAHWNRYDLGGERANGLDLIENYGERTVMIGRFPAIAERWPGIAVVEREPRAGEYPESALPELLANAKFVAVTASAIVNGSMPGILAMCKGAKVLVVGPSTPLAPQLYEHGIDILSGYVASDVGGIARAIGEGASVAAIRPFGRYVTIRRG